MIRVTVLYPNSGDAKFDFDYYASNHLNLLREKMGSDLRDVEFVKGLSDAGGGQAPYAAIANLLFDSIESFQETMGKAAGDVMSDIPNYTDIQPQIQISEVIS